jgi:hypothetical protein
VFRLVVEYCVVVKTPMAIAGRFRQTSLSAGGGRRMPEALLVFIQCEWLAEKNAEHKDEFRSLAILVRIFPGSYVKISCGAPYISSRESEKCEEAI